MRHERSEDDEQHQIGRRDTERQTEDPFRAKVKEFNRTRERHRWMIEWRRQFTAPNNVCHADHNNQWERHSEYLAGAFETEHDEENSNHQLLDRHRPYSAGVGDNL